MMPSTNREIYFKKEELACPFQQENGNIDGLSRNQNEMFIRQSTSKKDAVWWMAYLET